MVRHHGADRARDLGPKEADESAVQVSEARRARQQRAQALGSESAETRWRREAGIGQTQRQGETQEVVHADHGQKVVAAAVEHLALEEVLNHTWRHLSCERPEAGRDGSVV